MIRIVWLLIFSLPVAMSGQYHLEVEAHGVETSEGFIQVALYKKGDDFLKIEQVFRNTGAPATSGISKVLLEDLPPGEYAVAIFHDENGNEELDTNWLGIPREPLGFSRARMKTFGPPGFQECAIMLQGNMTVQIFLE